MKNKKPCVVTTEHRGVFFGYLENPEETDLSQPVKIYGKQMCTYWSQKMRGVFGLAKFGPDKECRIGAPVEWALIKNVTAIVGCSKEAEENWLKQPWQ